MTLDELKAQKFLAWKELKDASMTLKSVEVSLEIAKTAHTNAKSKYEQLDLELAKLDGRMQKVSTTKSALDRKAEQRLEHQALDYLNSLPKEELAKLLKSVEVELPEEIPEEEIPEETEEVEDFISEHVGDKIELIIEEEENEND